MKSALLIALGLILSVGVFGQESHIQFRFDNAKLSQDKAAYTIDVEVMSNTPETALYAINLRMFYEANNLSFDSYSNFKTGYNLINEFKKPKIGAAKSAQKMFGLTGAAGYINQGIELKEINIADWKSGQWEKLVTLNFDVVDIRKSGSFCPSFIWDKQKEMDQGGFLQGSMGTVASMIGLNGEEFKCKSASCNYLDFNWELSSASAPFGLAQKNVCIDITPDLSIEDIDSDFILFQNNPNPYLTETDISFSIPKEEEVTFTIFDVNGVLLHKNTEYYEAGSHIVKLDKRLNLPAGTMFYQIESEGFKSESKRMVKLK